MGFGAIGSEMDEGKFQVLFLIKKTTGMVVKRNHFLSQLIQQKI